MCIAILNTTGKLDYELFVSCWESNPDGAGIAYVDQNNVRFMKEMESVYDFYLQYCAIRAGNDLPMIIHFRVATSGMVNEENCHPFEVFPGLAMAHNGILDHVNPTASTCDTRIFNKQILSGLPKDFMYNEAIKQLLTVFIEDSLIIFLDKYGMYNILNERLGHWDEHHQNWFSNYSYLQYSEFGLWKPQKKKNKRSTANRDMEYCQGCDNFKDFLQMEFKNEFGIALCKQCIEWYSEMEGNC
ncbi:class II glutamine amidotransferase [Sphingobacterium siyangense]|uniref:class II glutamine amidotransferase n=1 Tax=Sphingobacterium siyangense TaxID=459529 RepID=UPI002FDAFBA1